MSSTKMRKKQNSHSNKNIVIGKIVGHHGVRGELKIYPYSDDVEKFLDFDHLYAGGKQLEIDSVRIHKGMALVLFEGHETIEKGLYLVGKEVDVEREYVDDGEGGHFIVDLIGLDIVDEDGEKLGVLRHVLTHTAQDVYEVEDVRGGTFLVPVVDAFVKDVSPEKGRIVVSLIDGLRE